MHRISKFLRDLTDSSTAGERGSPGSPPRPMIATQESQWQPKPPSQSGLQPKSQPPAQPPSQSSSFPKDQAPLPKNTPRSSAALTTATAHAVPNYSNLRPDVPQSVSSTGDAASTVLSLGANCALSLASVMAELAQIPYIHLAMDGLTLVFRAVERSKVNREQWRLLRGRCVMVCRIAGAQAQQRQNDDRGIEKACSILNTTITQIGNRVDHWNHMGELLAFLQFSDISEEIRSYFSALDSCLSAFSYNTRTARLEWIVEFNVVQAKELTQLEEMRIFMGEIDMQVDTAIQDPTILADMESRIKERLRQAMLENFEILQSPASAEAAVYAKAQQIVQTIRAITDIQLPPTLLVGNPCTLDSPLPIRSGLTCDVYSASFLDTEKVAKKVFRVGTSEQEAVNRYAERFLRDAKLWATFKCEYTLPFYGVGMEAAGRNKEAWQIYMVSPMMMNFDAVTYLKKYRNNPKMKEGILRIITDAAEGLKYLHGRHPPVVHSGVRGDNILITDSGGGILGGFGLTKVLSTGEAPPAVMTGRTDSYRWMAPEMLSGDQPALQTPSDVWSWGMAALELISGRIPYHRINQPWEVLLKIHSSTRPVRSDYVEFDQYALKPDEMWSLLERCWVIKPEERANIDQVVEELHSMLDGPVITETTPSLSHKASVQSTFQEPVPISRLMSAAEVITHLCNHGCQDITAQLDDNSISDTPMFHGGSGDIYYAKLHKGDQIAIKTMRMLCWANDVTRDFKDVARELHTWSKCEHRNVHKLLGVARFRNQIGMISAWMEFGNLPHYLAQHPNADHCQISIQICEGLGYLHHGGIVHGDLKGANVLMSSTGVPVLTDFGNAKMKDRTLHFTSVILSNPNLTLRWAAPELLGKTSVLTKEADVYALGMTILEIITGVVPWPEKDDRLVYIAVALNKQIPNRPSNITAFGSNVWQLLIRCWSGVPEQRPSVMEIIDALVTINNHGVSSVRRGTGHRRGGKFLPKFFGLLP